MIHINENDSTDERMIKIDEYIFNCDYNFSIFEVSKIVLEVMNMGMTLRQNQLNGHDTEKSGKEMCLEYLINYVEDMKGNK